MKYYLVQNNDLYGDQPRGPYGAVQVRGLNVAYPNCKMITGAELKSMWDRDRFYENNMIPIDEIPDR